MLKSGERSLCRGTALLAGVVERHLAAGPAW
jgi:hypothetical protein